MSKIRTFFLNVLFNVQIVLWIRLSQYSKDDKLPQNRKLANKMGGKINETPKRLQTSVAGSNIFFRSKHSLGFPIGSGAKEVKSAGRAGTVTEGCPFIGKVMPC